jgi:hypothetical protein
MNALGKAFSDTRRTLRSVLGRSPTMSNAGGTWVTAGERATAATDGAPTGTAAGVTHCQMSAAPSDTLSPALTCSPPASLSGLGKKSLTPQPFSPMLQSNLLIKDARWPPWTCAHPEG